MCLRLTINLIELASECFSSLFFPVQWHNYERNAPDKPEICCFMQAKSRKRAQKEGWGVRGGRRERERKVRRFMFLDVVYGGMMSLYVLIIRINQGLMSDFGAVWIKDIQLLMCNYHIIVSFKKSKDKQQGSRSCLSASLPTTHGCPVHSQNTEPHQREWESSLHWG